MDNGVITGFFTLGGVALTFLYNYLSDRKSRGDKYYFALLEKRLIVYQDAHSLSIKLLQSLHSSRIDDITTDARDWYNNNNLYLSPKLRKDFCRLLNLVSTYALELEEWKSIPDPDQRDAKAKEFKENFNFIGSGFQKLIEKEIDLYYYEHLNQS